MAAICHCKCDGEVRCGRQASNYCDVCLQSLCGACFSVVQLPMRHEVFSPQEERSEHVRDYCDECFTRIRMVLQNGVDLQVVSVSAHCAPVLASVG